MGTLWHWCVKMREAIELPFGVVSGVGPGIGLLDGGPDLPREGNFFLEGGFLSIGLHLIFDCTGNKETYSTGT